MIAETSLQATPRRKPLTGAPWYGAWAEQRARYARAVNEMGSSGEAALRRELIFCLLGGHGVSFELALSATDRVMRMAPFSERWTSKQLQQRLFSELSTPQFDPRRQNGQFRRYRFPNRKSQLISAAREWVRSEGPLGERLAAIPDEKDRRVWLSRCPGLGPKSTSWLLRNAGLARNLAVIDVHVLRAMHEFGCLPPVRLPKDYELIESRFLVWCSELDTSAAELDLFLWEWQRGSGQALDA
jgi:N-glycosylase/DNA lyase